MSKMPKGYKKLGDCFYKILNPTNGAINSMNNNGLTWTFASSVASFSGNINAYGWSNLVPEVDPNEDGSTKIRFKKDDMYFEMTREQMYTLKFILDNDGYTIESCPLEEFLNYVTAVKI